ncbi:hypothetical protein FEM03_09855 [Phragmitibacter flavus]|uniref:Glycosyltransferase family 4 protein n=1 Tax=Phragmitibacter flavus TaxID=2576071 RepID=A0A5R8KFW7_9BACT|nr:hypothetical protein [Phragmitibacter flavus]TLD71198.1 hypothetical protein FEM03_09855 [Phragmitibacter flavus]
MSHPIPLSDTPTRWEPVLESCLQELRAFITTPGLGSLGLGVADLDMQLWMLGQEWLREHPPLTPATGLRDVYLTTQIYDKGGHTPLIGDFARALASDENTGDSAPPHLIVTNLLAHNKPKISQAILDRLDFHSDQITLLTGPTLDERLHQLFTQLITLRPKRLFLFHHPDDPLPCVVAHDAICPRRYLVHHADATPSFGLHLPDTPVIELNPYAAALSRSQGLDPGLLIPTCPDPGPRPTGFLSRGKLVTATCGSEHKYIGATSCPYTQAVAVILRTTGGWHIHIGPLSETLLAEIHAGLDRFQIPPDRFTHVRWAPSLAHCLWEHHCDLYLSSYPIDGARANAEVAASSTPHLRRLCHPGTPASPDFFEYEGGLTWRNWDDLIATLQTLIAEPTSLENRSVAIRESYQRLHHPEIFAANLRELLDHGPGHQDPQSESRQLQVMRTVMHHSLVQARKNHLELLRHRDQTIAKIQSLEQTIQSLQRPVRRWWQPFRTQSD